MPTRNTAVLTQMVDALGDLVLSAPHALAKLEHRFKDTLIINAGDVTDVARHAEKLRLFITDDERAVVLDYIARSNVVNVTIDHVEDAINTLFEDRFQEP